MCPKGNRASSPLRISLQPGSILKLTVDDVWILSYNYRLKAINGGKREEMMRTLLSWIALSLATSVPAAAVDIRAGLEPWPIGSTGIVVHISPPVSSAVYSAVVQQTNTAGYSTLADCTYFNVLHLAPTQFEVQHKTCKDGTPVAVDTGITLTWILVTKQ
jgi:hypothetical protein